MIFVRPGLINKNQRGFTGIEVAITIAISGVIAAAAITTTLQMISGSSQSNNHMTAVRQVENAGYWVSRDVQMAQSVQPGVTSGFPITLLWNDWAGDQHQVVYSLDLISGELERSHSINSGAPTDTTRAQLLDSANCEFNGGGAFSLPDVNDEFTITGGPVADSGTITVTTGSISVATTGAATYNAGTGAWTTTDLEDTIVVTATAASTEGIWTSTAASATAAITQDADGNATVTEDVFTLTVVASVGSGSQQRSETRTFEITPRPGALTF